MAVESRHSTSVTRSGGVPRLATILMAVAVGVLAACWLNHLYPPFQITDDGVRDQLLARDCADLGRCHLIGPRTSVPGFYQGAVWVDLLVAVRLLGGGVVGARLMVLGLLACSIATLFLVVARWLRPTLALPAAVIMIAVLTLDTYPSQLINPSGAALPDVLTAAGLLCHGLSGRRRFLLLAAWALGVAVNVHVGALSLLPALIAVASMARNRPLPWLLAALAIVVGASLITSSAATLANLYSLSRFGRLLPALAGIGVIAVAGLWLGRRFKVLSWNARAWLIGGLIVGPYACATVWLLFAQQHHFGLTYLHPVLAPAAVLIAAMIAWPFEVMGRRHRAWRWLPTAASAAAVIAMLANPRSATSAEPSGWSYAEANAIGAHFFARGGRYEDLVFRIQSVSCRQLLLGMAIEAPPPGAPAGPDNRQLQIARVATDSAAALGKHDVVDLEGGRVAVVRGIDSWLHPESLVACRRPVDGSAAAACADARPRIETTDPERFLFVTRTFPEIHGLELPPPYIATYEIPLSPIAGESRDLTVVDPEPGVGCGWSITRVEGLVTDRELPADHVRVRSQSGSPGRVLFERAPCSSGSEHYPPCVLETAPGDPLQPFLENRR